MDLSEHIKLKRKKNGLTQVELAQRAGVGLRFVRDLEQGKKTLRMDKVNDILFLFGEYLGPVKNDWDLLKAITNETSRYLHSGPLLRHPAGRRRRLPFFLRRGLSDPSGGRVSSLPQQAILSKS